jgi:hypothetical protein
MLVFQQILKMWQIAKLHCFSLGCKQILSTAETVGTAINSPFNFEKIPFFFILCDETSSGKRKFMQMSALKH